MESVWQIPQNEVGELDSCPEQVSTRFTNNRQAEICCHGPLYNRVPAVGCVVSSLASSVSTRGIGRGRFVLTGF